MNSGNQYSPCDYSTVRETNINICRSTIQDVCLIKK